MGILLRVIIGASLGLIVGIAVAAGAGLWSEWRNPDDPSAGAVSIIVIFTAPIGLFAGATAGAMSNAFLDR